MSPRPSHAESLQPMERLLLWRLALSGGAWLSKLAPKPDTKHRTSLKKAGLILEEKRRPEQGGPSSTFLELTDAGWAWLNDHVSEPMAVTPRATTAPTLEAIVLKLGHYLETTETSLAEFLDPRTGSTTQDEMTPEADDDLAGRIASAYDRLAGGRAGVRVRLADLRDALTDVPRDHLDRSLLDLNAAGTVALLQLDNPLEISPRDEAAALRTPAGDIRHILYLGKP